MPFKSRAVKLGGGCRGGVGGERWRLSRKKGEVWGAKWLAKTKRKVTHIHGDPHVMQERQQVPDLRMTVGD